MTEQEQKIKEHIEEMKRTLTEKDITDTDSLFITGKIEGLELAIKILNK